MQPASTTGSTNRGSSLRRWGPIAGIGAVAAIGVGVFAATSGGDDDALVSTTADVTVTSVAVDSTQPDANGEPSTTVEGNQAGQGGEVTFPLSFSQATEQGLADSIDWGPRCDTTRGRLAVPDYFAPECMAPFSGDNGGATAPGVTGDDITVVYYEGQENDPVIQFVTSAVAVDDTNAQQFDTMRGIVDYYETYFELYGRRVNLITYEGTGGALDEVAARADATAIAEQFDPFIVFGGPALTSAFGDELAAREVMCIGCVPGQPASFYNERDPYVWALDGSQIQKQTHVVEFVEKQLVGKNAEFGGDDVASQPRTFGLIYLESSAASKELADRFAGEMEAIGAPFVETVSYLLDPSTLAQSATQVITKMKAAGVTTIVFSGDPVAPTNFTQEATAQGYFPEWMVAASTLVDTTAFARTYDQEQWSHAFGVTQLAARTDAQTIGAYAVYEWFHGAPPAADGSIAVMQPNPALFFAVVQGVGPNLTPEAFRDTLFAAEGTLPGISVPYLSYGDKGYWDEPDYHGVDDATMFWWDPTAPGPDELRRDGVGMYQFVDGGQRYLPGEWPTDSTLFDPTGAVSFYGTPPAGEEPGEYEPLPPID
jgi:hypothetical protein